MWLHWLGPLLGLAFLAGLVSAAVLLRLGKVHGRRRILATAALPFGCLAVPLLGLSILAVAGWAFRPG
ncbi:hypothetical protein [Novosphingobium mathurense]|uniref:Uncharacterized protein n=2 Tax=Novosphingobium TaxID=165696 RepID=A0A1U6IP20_9SPHN|nr:hypothetical protein [Novosphingobium mathurense]SLK09758.1 hypothetical protein SAMN06295987_11049 [Novosphingobium mathurense]